MGTAREQAGAVDADSPAGSVPGDRTRHEASTDEPNSVRKAPTVRFWGVRGSVPVSGDSSWRYGGNTTCLQVCIPDEQRVIVIDMGTGARVLGLELEKYRDSIQGLVFFTHVHWDHIHGIPFFKPFFRPGNQFKLFVPEQEKDSASSLLLGQMSAPHFPVSADAMVAELCVKYLQSGSMDFGTFRLDHLRANHHSNTVIYKVEVDGWCLVFAPDNELTKEESPVLNAFVRGADLLIHDGQYDRCGYETKKNWGHSSWENVVDMAMACEVKQLILTHHDPESDDKLLASRESLLRRMTEGSSLKAAIAREGMEIGVFAETGQK